MYKFTVLFEKFSIKKKKKRANSNTALPIVEPGQNNGHQGAGKRPQQCCHPKGGNGAEGPKGPRTKGTATRGPKGPESGQNMRVRGPEGPEDEQS